MRKIVLLTLFLTIVAGCGETAQAPASTPTTQPTQATPASTTVKATLSAEQIVKALQARGLPIGAFTVYTAETDLNHLLGRPGQYISKASFKDTRIVSQTTDFGVSDGGSVETFATAKDAQGRFAYLQSLSTSGNALFAEYEYIEGLVVLRVSSQLTPDQAKAYDTALKGLLS